MHPQFVLHMLCLYKIVTSLNGSLRNSFNILPDPMCMWVEVGWMSHYSQLMDKADACMQWHALYVGNL